ncbi:MAG: hypothetical protein WDZ76_02755 [Pseudohongiellaceae bacterium]
METTTEFHTRRLKEIIPESQNELFARILPMAVAAKEGQELEEEARIEFSYLARIWRDREVLWARYPSGLLACKTIGDLVDYLYKRHERDQSDQSRTRPSPVSSHLTHNGKWRIRSQAQDAPVRAKVSPLQVVRQ